MIAVVSSCILFASLILWQTGALASPSAPAETVWSSPTPVAVTTPDSRAPSIGQTTGGTRYVAWEEGTDIYSSVNGGVGWSGPVLAANGEAPVVVVSDTVPYIIFENEISGNREIYIIQWQGSNWSLPKNVSQTSGGSFAPDAAIGPDGKIYVVWADNSAGSNHLYLASSADGSNWSGGAILINGVPVAGSAPALAVDPSGTLHIAWQDRDGTTGKLEILYTRGDGSTWSLAENLSGSSTINSAFADVVAEAGGIASVTWEEDLASGSEIYFTSGQPGNWSVPQSVSASANVASVLPSLDRDGAGGLHLAWAEGNPATAIEYSDWPAGNPGWTAPITLTAHSAGLGDVMILASASNPLYAVWAQSGNTSWDIYSASGVPVTPTPTPTSTPTVQYVLYLPLIRR
ncbi:MAG: exo-alpha-sialidase [Chloroflexi bacterium]|nr:exo-alpha-sialidase [Chloroflexota bacterium]